MQKWHSIKYFRKDEFACSCGCGLNNIDFELVKLLDTARHLAGVPFILSSACRCSSHNFFVGGSSTSSHLDGFAVDIVLDNSVSRYKILNSLLFLGFKRVGLASDFVHVDIDINKSQNVFWLYKNKKKINKKDL